MLNKYYHVDFLSKLVAGSVINQMPGHSQFGKICHIRFQGAGLLEPLETGRYPSGAELNRLNKSHQREFLLEHARLHHPNVENRKTSRLNAFFATKSIEDAQDFVARRPLPPGVGYRIFEIHADGDHPIHDMSWIDFDFDFSRHPKHFAHYLVGYWSQKMTSEDEHIAIYSRGRQPLREVLITSPVRIGERVE